jgi:predicted secreted protein
MGYEPNQIFIAPTFQALYMRAGRITVSREELQARQELCEDMAQQVAEQCGALQFEKDLPESEALRLCHQGLKSASGIVSEAEAAWVVRRTAELLQWPCPEWLADLVRSVTPS